MARGFSHQFSPIINRRPNAHCTGQEQQSVHTHVHTVHWAGAAVSSHTCTYSALGRSSSQFTHMYTQCTGQEQQSVHTHVHTVHWAGAAVSSHTCTYSATISGIDLGEGHGQALG